MTQHPASDPAPDSNVSASASPSPSEHIAVFRTRRRVEWAETDAAGIAHFTALFRYMEEAEHALLRAAGLSVSCHDEQQQHISWPRVSAQADFLGPARFGDVIDIEVGIQRLGRKSITYRFRLACDGRPIAQGHVTAVCCRVDPHQQGLQAIPIPQWFIQRLGRLDCQSSADHPGRDKTTNQRAAPVSSPTNTTNSANSADTTSASDAPPQT